MNHKVLLIVTALLVALAVLLHRGDDNDRSAAAAGQPFLPQLGALVDDLATITITRAGDETVATLDRDGERWTVRERDGYPADMNRIRGMIRALAEARIVEPKTASERFYDRLGVEAVSLADAAGTQVTLAGGTQTVAVIIGDIAADGQRFVRLANAEQSYQIDRDPAPATATGSWLDARILDLANDRVQQVTIRHADGEHLTLTRQQPGQTNFTIEPVPEGRELLYPGVGNTVGGALRSLNLEDVYAADDGLPELAADVSVEYRTFDGLIISVEGMLRDEQTWATFRAEVDTDAAAADLAERQSEADAINARVAGWRYRLPAFQYEQIARRIDDLLQAA